MISSPQPSLLKGSSSSQGNRKSSLSAVINKLKSVNDAISATESEDKKSEYQIKSSGSDGIKITFNKTKSSKGSKTQHTGLKPGVNSGPASKKSSQYSKSSSQKLLYQKSNSSGSLTSLNSTVPSPKSSSQPGKSSSSKESNFSSFNSNEMLKNMLNIASQAPRTDIVKAFDKKFQIPKLSARGKSDEKPTFDDSQNFNNTYPRPTTPVRPSAPSPTIDFMRESSSSNSNHFQMSPYNFFSNTQQQNKFADQQRQSKKLLKSASSEQLYVDESMVDKTRKSNDISDADYQALFRTQPQMNESSVSMRIVKSPLEGNMLQSGGQQVSDASDTFNDDIMSFIGNEI